MDYSRYKTHLQRRNKRKKFWLTVVLLLISIGPILAFMNSRTPSDSHQEAEGQTISLPPLSPTPTDLPNSTTLESVVQNALTGTHGSYGIVVNNLTTNEYYGFNAHRSFKSGSLYKLWVMAVVYQQIQQGTLHPKDVLKKDLGVLAKEFNITIDPSEPQTTGVLSMTVEDALYEMVTISDNNAALLLTNKIKLSSVATFLKKYSLNESKVGTRGEDPVTTASDIALFFDKLYKGQLANTDQTTSMLTLLKGQRLNDKIPQNLPNNLPIAHKTGEIDDYTHDAGIIYSPQVTYCIVILSQSDDTDAAKNRIANISEAVYNYFNPTSN